MSLGVQFSACFVIFVYFFSGCVLPTSIFWFLLSVKLVVVVCPSPQFLVEMVFGQGMFRMFLKHLSTKVWMHLLAVTVSLQVSDPYSSTDFTFELKILILVQVLRARGFSRQVLRLRRPVELSSCYVLICSSCCAYNTT